MITAPDIEFRGDVAREKGTDNPPTDCFPSVARNFGRLLGRLVGVRRRMVDKAKRWQVIEDIDSPCADISFSYGGPNALAVRMHFSRVVDRSNRDLVLWFKNAIALRWWTESADLSQLRESLPTCSVERWSAWTFPLLKVQDSSWLREHAARDSVEAQGREHFLLVSMNDVCELLAVSVVATWVDANAGA